VCTFSVWVGGGNVVTAKKCRIGPETTTLRLSDVNKKNLPSINYLSCTSVIFDSHRLALNYFSVHITALLSTYFDTWSSGASLKGSHLKHVINVTLSHSTLCRSTGGTEVQLHYLGTRWRWVTKITPRPFSPRRYPRCPLSRRLGWFQNRSRRFGEKKKFFFLLGFKLNILRPVAAERM